MHGLSTALVDLVFKHGTRSFVPFPFLILILKNDDLTLERGIGQVKCLCLQTWGEKVTSPVLPPFCGRAVTSQISVQVGEVV